MFYDELLPMKNAWTLVLYESFPWNNKKFTYEVKNEQDWYFISNKADT